jgi:hypothetical protein
MITYWTQQRTMPILYDGENGFCPMPVEGC